MHFYFDSCSLPKNQEAKKNVRIYVLSVSFVSGYLIVLVRRMRISLLTAVNCSNNLRNVAPLLTKQLYIDDRGKMKSKLSLSFHMLASGL